MNTADPLLEVKNITKVFPGVIALEDVGMEVRRGEVHALIGENGAGKSTLMKCIIGMYRPTKGEIFFEGKKRDIGTTKQALDLGISMIHQELSPVLHRPIMENIWLGREPLNKFGFVDHKKMYEDTLELLLSIDMQDDPKTLMRDLTVAKIQMVEILKAVSYDAKLIIMDEPTSSLTNHEVEDLFQVIRRLKSQNRSIIYISHKMDEIFEIADRVTIFRDGKYIKTADTSGISMDEIINLMVGRDVSGLFQKQTTEPGQVILEVQNLSSGKKFKDVSFTLKKGEILGFAGLVGAGRTEVVETLFGVRPKTSGRILLNGKEVRINNARDAIGHKMALLTEERRETGIFPVLSVDYNMVVANMKKYLRKSGFLNFKTVKEDCDKYVRDINIKTPSLSQQIQFLSGGNQQKVLVARWLLTSPDILFMDEPTRGIDVGAKTEIYKLIEKLAQSGKSIIMVSSELPEIIGLSDRIVVFHEGSVTAILERSDGFTQENIMTYATGAQKQESVA